jgi:hypothetical protein
MAETMRTGIEARRAGRRKRAEPHAIDLAEMLAWLADSERAFTAYASSSSEPKRLEIAAGRAVYRVTHGTDVVYLGTQPHDAVEAYNNIR